MGLGLNGLWQITFPFNAKVVAASSKTAQINAMLAVGNLEQVGCGVAKWQVATDVMQVIGKLVGAVGVAFCCLLQLLLWLGRMWLYLRLGWLHGLADVC